MILTDYLPACRNASWDIALECGVKYGTIRLPEDEAFDPTLSSHLRAVVDRFQSAGITPLVLEPLPNALHDHIKAGDALRDSSIDKFILLMKNLRETGITTVCFNFMAHYGWTRTAVDLEDRGGARVTGFSLADFTPDDCRLTREAVWENYLYFIKAVLPYAEQYGIRLALHPDDPPLPALGGVARIFTSLDDIRRGIDTVKSPNLGVTFCQACYYLMGEDLTEAVRALSDRIFFIHFRNVRGDKSSFRETFHDDGDVDMAAMIGLYAESGLDMPIRVDHVPTLAGEQANIPGYDVLGRLFAIGYLKGLLEGVTRNV